MRELLGHSSRTCRWRCDLVMLMSKTVSSIRHLQGAVLDRLVRTVSGMTRTPGRSWSINQSTTLAVVIVMITLAIRPAKAQTVTLVGAVPLVATVVTTRVLAWFAPGFPPLSLFSLGLPSLSTASLLIEVNFSILEIFSLLALQLLL